MKRINVLSRLLKKLTIIILTLASVTVIYLMILQHGLSIRNITSEIITQRLHCLEKIRRWWCQSG